MSTLLSERWTAHVDLLCGDLAADIESIVESAEAANGIEAARVEALAGRVRDHALELIRLARRMEHGIRRGGEVRV